MVSPIIGYPLSYGYLDWGIMMPPDGVIGRTSIHKWSRHFGAFRAESDYFPVSGDN
jgi:hypothetical protein